MAIGYTIGFAKMKRSFVLRRGKRSSRWLALSFLLPVLAGVVALVIFMARIDGLIERQRVAISGNLTWEVAELEVDVLNFSNAIMKARLMFPRPDAASLSEVRRTYDILYSRVTMLSANSYADSILRGDVFMPELNIASADILSSSKVIDGSDDELTAALSELSDAVDRSRASMRLAIVKTLQSLVAEAEAKRLSIVFFLQVFTVITIVLVLFLFFAAIALLHSIQTAQRRARESERMTEELRSTVEASLDAVIRVDIDGRIQQYNSAAEVIFGVARSEVLGKRLLDLELIEGLDRVCQSWRRGEITDSSFILRREVLTGRRRGMPITLEVTVAIVEDRGGEQVFVCFMHDISSQREAEEDLKRARDEALASEKAKSRFLAVMSHEMRTPLTGMIAALDMAKETLPPLEAGREDFLRIARRCAFTALEQVNELLELTRLNHPGLVDEAHSFDLISMIDEVVDQYQSLAIERGVLLVIDVHEVTARHIVASRRLVSRILMNLLSNAIKFTHKGRIDVIASIAADSSGWVLSLSVRDTGIGIPHELHDRIFENFETGDASYTRRTEGTGLGLGIVRLAAQRLGGSISLESLPGVGSTFHVRIPVELDLSQGHDVQENDQVQPVGFSSQPKNRIINVLLAEDNEISRILLRKMIIHLGHRVWEAQNGAEAVSLANERNFDLILMDVSMPVMDGLEATRRIRTHQGLRPRIVGLTAHAMPEQHADCLAAQMDSVELKPITLDRLREKLDEVAAEDSDSMPGQFVDNQIFGEAQELMGSERFRHVVLMVLMEGRELLNNLSRGWTTIPRDDLVRRIHRLAGSFGMVGATALSAKLVEVEQTLIRGSELEIAREFVLLDGIWHESSTELMRRAAD